MGGVEQKEVGFVAFDCFCLKGAVNQMTCVEFRINHAYRRIRCFQVAEEAL